MKKDEAELISRKVKESTGMFAASKLKSASVGIVIHRHATNKDENIGLVSYYNSNPFKHYYINFKIWLRGRYRLWRQF